MTSSEDFLFAERVFIIFESLYGLQYGLMRKLDNWSFLIILLKVVLLIVLATIIILIMKTNIYIIAGIKLFLECIDSDSVAFF